MPGSVRGRNSMRVDEEIKGWSLLGIKKKGNNRSWGGGIRKELTVLYVVTADVRYDYQSEGQINQGRI